MEGVADTTVPTTLYHLYEICHLPDEITDMEILWGRWGGWGLVGARLRVSSRGGVFTTGTVG